MNTPKLKIVEKDGMPSPNAIFVKLIGADVDNVLQFINSASNKKSNELEFVLEPGYTGVVSYPFFVREIFDYDHSKDITVWVPNETVYDHAYKALPVGHKDIFLRYDFDNNNRLLFIPGYAVREAVNVYAKTFTSAGLNGRFTNSFQDLLGKTTREDINLEIKSGKTYFEYQKNMFSRRWESDSIGQSYWGRISFGLVESVSDCKKFIHNVCNGSPVLYDAGPVEVKVLAITSGLIGSGSLTLEETVKTLYNTLKEMPKLKDDKAFHWKVCTSTASQIASIKEIIGAAT